MNDEVARRRAGLRNRSQEMDSLELKRILLNNFVGVPPEERPGEGRGPILEDLRNICSQKGAAPDGGMYAGRVTYGKKSFGLGWRPQKYWVATAS